VKYLAPIVAVSVLGLSATFCADGPPSQTRSEPKQSLAELLKPIETVERASSAALDALERPASLQFERTPFVKVVDHLRNLVGGGLLLDQECLAKVQLAPDAPITFKMHGLRLRTAMDALLEPRSLTYMLRDEMVIITDKESERKNTLVRLYPVADLVLYPAHPEFVMSGVLMNLIINTVDGEVWEANGGHSTVKFYPGSLTLAIKCPDSTHRSVQTLLSGLRGSRARTEAILKAAGLPESKEVFRRAPSPDRQAGLGPFPWDAAPFQGSGLAGTQPTDVRTSARRMAEMAMKVALDIEAEEAKKEKERETKPTTPPSAAPATPAPESKK
jgi:hypothetical protein